jgi:hypothetical protein
VSGNHEEVRPETAVSKTYQNTAASASVDVGLPERLTIGLVEIAASAREGLLVLAVGTGMQVMEAMFAEDVERLCGPRNKHEACLRYVEELRWPDGFSCPACGARSEPWRATRDRLVCRVCRRQTRVTAGTIFDKTRTPLT